MSDVVDAQRQVGKSAVIVRVAGALLVLLGLANVVLAGIAAWTDAIQLSGSADVALGVLGVVTAVLGVFVLLGQRWALLTALVVFGGLFVVQAFAASGGDEPAPAVLTLAVVVLPLVLAVRATRPEG